MSCLVPPPAPRKRRRKKRGKHIDVVTSVKLPRALATAIRLEAKKQDITQSQLLRRILLAYINYQNAGPKSDVR